MEFDPTAIGEVEDPYPLYAAQRTAAPVARADSGLWCVTGYDEASTLLRDPRSTTGVFGEHFRQMLPQGSAARSELGRRINLLDPPDHTRVRGLVGKAFTPRRIEALRPWIRRAAAELLAAADAEAGDDGTIDVLPVAHALPSLVISELLGVPDADRPLLSELTEATTVLLSFGVGSEAWQRGLDASERFAEYVEGLIDDRRKNPGEDLLSALVAAEDAGDRLDHEELMSLVVTLYAAGHRTTRDLFSNGLAALLRRGPEQRVAAAADPARATEEIVRYATPTHYVARAPREPMQVGDVEIGALEMVLVFLAAANRDPRRFPEPETFDVTRPPDPPPLSFALGAHFCLGASLARAEVATLLDATLTRWPALTAVEEDGGWWASGPFRGLNSLRVITTG